MPQGPGAIAVGVASLFGGENARKILEKRASEGGLALGGVFIYTVRTASVFSEQAEATDWFEAFDASGSFSICSRSSTY